MTRYFYHGTDPIRLTKIRKKGLCHGLPWYERRFPLIAFADTEADVPDPGIYVGASLETGLRFAYPAHDPEHGFTDKYRREPHEKEPVAILRFERNDPTIRSCTKRLDPEFEGRKYPVALILSCPTKCIKPQAEICLLPLSTLKETLGGLRSLAGYAEKIEHLPCKWRPLKWS